MLRVLVTNAGYRKSVPIIRALGKAGMQVICADTSPLAMGFFSRYSYKKFTYPEIDNDEFFDAFISQLDKNPCDVILPLNDDMLLELSTKRNLLPDPSALLLPSHDRLVFASDKSKLVPFAGELGIPIPNTLIVSKEEDIAKCPDLTFPLVLKPSEGSGSRGVSWVYDRISLNETCRRLIRKGHTVLVQEAIPKEGRGMGYSALFDREGNIVAEFIYQRLREYPLSGGPSTLRESIWRDDLAEMSRKLLFALDWVGLAMVEYKIDSRDGQPKLMEINPRFWGSIALPIFCDVNFPVLAAKVTAGIPVAPQPRYPLGKSARWLWPGDILHLCSSVFKGKWPTGFLKPYGKDTCDDLISIDDPLPILVFTLNLLRKLFSPKAWRHSIFRR